MSTPRKCAPTDIGIFLPSWLGDFAMATPTLRTIRQQFGKATRIVGIMRPYLKEVLAGTNWLDEQWYFNPHQKSPETGHRAILRKIREAEFDMMVLMPNSPRSAVLAWLGSAVERIGYVRNGRGPLLTGKVYRPKVDGQIIDLPMVDYYLRLAETIGCSDKSQRLELATTEKDEESADQVFENLGLRQDGCIITLNCSGAYGGAKLWPVEYFAELARRVVTDLDHDILVMCGPNEKQDRQGDRPPRQASAGFLDGRPTAGHRNGKSLHSPQPVDGLHGQRATSRRRCPGMRGNHRLRSDAPRVGPESDGGRRGPLSRGPRLYRLWPTNMPARSPQVHARPLRGSCFRGSGFLDHAA